MRYLTFLSWYIGTTFMALLENFVKLSEQACEKRPNYW